MEKHTSISLSLLKKNLAMGFSIFLVVALLGCNQGFSNPEMTTKQTSGSNLSAGLLSLAHFLGPGGFLNIPHGFSGSIDARGYRLISGSGEAPRFAPNTVSGDEKWSADFIPNGADGNVHAITFDEYGTVYIGGEFLAVGGVRAAHIASWDGREWSSLGGGVDDSVFVLLFDQTNDFLYAGGNFTHICTSPDCTVKSISVNHIARWSEGSWSAMDYGVDGQVGALVLDSQNNLYVGGGFKGYCLDENCATYVTANNIALWRCLLPSWHVLGSGTNIGVSSGVAALAWDPWGPGYLYIGGSFQQAGGQESYYVVRFIPAYIIWEPLSWNGYQYLNGPVYAFGVDSINHQLYIGGYFDSLFTDPLFSSSSITVNHIIRWDMRGEGWWKAQLGYGVNGNVTSLDVDSQGNVYAGGAFTRICDGLTCENGTPVSFIAEWAAAYPGALTGTWRDLEIGVSWSPYVIVVHGTDVFVGGCFDAAGLTAANYIATWNGNHWYSIDSGNGVRWYVYSLAVDFQGNVFAGGFFHGAGTKFVNNVAKWNGISWSALGSGLKGNVFALFVDLQGNLYAGGSFNYVCLDPICSQNGERVNHIARWDGTSWHRMGFGFNDAVRAFVLDHNGILYAGGSMTGICQNVSCTDATLSNNIARWDNASASWKAVPGLQTASHIFTLAVDYENHIYAGGLIGQVCVDFPCTTFKQVNGIVQWNGVSWSGVGYGVDGGVAELAIDGNGIMYAGGDFRNICNNETCSSLTKTNYIAKWNGQTWTPLNNGVNSFVNSLAIDGSNHLFIGGYFTGACLDSTCSQVILARQIIEWNGSDWVTLGSGISPKTGMNTDTKVYQIVWAYGKVSVGGTFSFVGDKVSTDFAQYQDNYPPSLTSFQKSGFSGSPVQFSPGDFTSHFSDPEHEALIKIKVLSLPTHGILTLQGNSIKIGQEIPVTDLGNLVYTSTPGWLGSTGFTWNGFDGNSYALNGTTITLVIDKTRLFIPLVIINP